MHFWHKKGNFRPSCILLFPDIRSLQGVEWIVMLKEENSDKRRRLLQLQALIPNIHYYIVSASLFPQCALEKKRRPNLTQKCFSKSPFPFKRALKISLYFQTNFGLHLNKCWKKLGWCTQIYSFYEYLFSIPVTLTSFWQFLLSFDHFLSTVDITLS